MASDDITKLVLTKMEIGRRQLSTAIKLWFADGDAVSIHTLAHAAYEIIHVISKKKGRTRDLIFDSAMIKDEHLGDWNRVVKAPGNFFKHAQNDHAATIEFDPSLSEFFFLFAILGLELSGEKSNDEEVAFMQWLCFHHPSLLTDSGRRQFVDRFNIKDLEGIRSVPKELFYKAVVEGRRLRGL